MIASLDLEHLVHVSGGEPRDGEIPCVVLVHNEINILPQFFAHYRSFGPIRFCVIDDRSTDGSSDFLAAQPDVTVFAPRPGSTYQMHKKQWRSELLDRFAADKWCLAPDADEHLVWRDAESRSFNKLVSDLEAEHVDGMVAIMVDMYCDRPIEDHISSGAPLEEDFPLFDDPTLDPLAYRLRLPKRSFFRRYPSPAMLAFGGMRDRVLMGGQDRAPILYRRLLRNSISKSHDPKGFDYFRERIIFYLTRRTTAAVPMDLTKVPLLRWKPGTSFSGGAHHLSVQQTFSSERGVLMHFPLTRGAQGARYTANRAQHGNSGGYYRIVEDHKHANPVYNGTARYTGSDSFRGFF